MRALPYYTAIWLLLMLLTATSWWLSGDFARTHSVTTVILVLVASFKVRLVGLHFMELRRAPWALRLLFEAWALLVCVMILLLYWRGTH